MNFPNIDIFIKNHVTFRKESLFKKDLESNNKYLISEIKNKSALVIGGAGTIGSSFIKSLLRYHPSELVVVDINENGLTELTRTLRSDSSIIVPKIYLTYPMSYNSEVFYKMFENHGKFDIVANFAAHKHVRSEKDSFSIEVMVKNNVLDAKCFLDFLKLHKPSHFFCVSTDKAANPVSIMGGSKKLMENVIMSYANDFKVTTARFANVAFSNGSLLYGYLERLFQRQPISCPSDVKRFFVSPSESGEICLITCILGKSGDIFFPKLTENQLISFQEITINFLKFLNKEIKICKSEKEAKEFFLKTENDFQYPVYFFKTDTSGEKLYEEFYTQNDEIELNKFNSIGIITNCEKSSITQINHLVNKIEKIFKKKKYEKEYLVTKLSQLISGFNHIERGKSLDQKM